MSGAARSVFGLSYHANLRGTGSAILVIVAMAAGFLWSSGHDDQRCAELVLLAILAPFMLAGAGAAGQIAALSRPARWCLGAFFVLGAASAMTSFSFRHAVYEWAMLLLLLLAASLLATELSRAGASGLKTVLHCVGGVGILYSLRILLLYAAALASGVQADIHALAIGFSNARFFNHAQTALLPLIVLLYLQAPKRQAWRPVWFALAAFWWSFLFLSEARATVLALGAGCAVAFAVRRAHARSFLKAMALTALAGAVVYALAFILLPVLAGLQPYNSAMDVLQRTAADPASRRTLLWELAFKLIAAHPWLGVGPQHFAHEGATLSWGAHPHNFILQIGAEWGVPALLCLLGAIGIGMRGLVRSGARVAPADLSGQQTLAVLLATGAAILVDGLFSGVIVMPQSQMAIVLYLGCAAGWVRSLEAGVAQRITPPMRWLTAGLAAIALCGLAFSVGPDVPRYARHEPLTPSEQAANPSTHWPRMWDAGYF